MVQMAKYIQCNIYDDIKTERGYVFGNIIFIHIVEYFTHFGSFDALYSVGISRLSSISTISTSPDWISAAPSHEIIIGIQSAPDVQFSGIWKALNKRKRLWLRFYTFIYYYDIGIDVIFICVEHRTCISMCSAINIYIFMLLCGYW